MIRTGKTYAGDDWSSPEWIFSLVGPCFDPCPLYGRAYDGLSINWHQHSAKYDHRVYVNPPYSKPHLWVDKAIEENKKGCTVIMLLKHDSSTQWYAKLKEYGAHMLMPMGRLCFGGKKSGCAFPSLLVVLN